MSAAELRDDLCAAIREAVKHYDEGDVTDELCRALDVLLDATRREASGPAVGGDMRNALHAAAIASFEAEGGEIPGYEIEQFVTELTARGVVVLGKADYDTIVKQRRKFAEIVTAAAAYFLFNGVDHEDPGCPEDDTCECPIASGITQALTNEAVHAADKLTGSST
jgi:hypothetical protein